MTEKVETPHTQLQKVTLLIAMQDWDNNDGFDAGEWLLNVLFTCADRDNKFGHYGAKEITKVMTVIKVENCDVVVSNGL